MIKQIYTHQVAVNAFLIHNDRFLLLKRATSPFIWGPPGGRLNPNEDPVRGLKREVAEETGLTIEVYHPVTTWFGNFNRSKILAIDYLCACDRDQVFLSPEHSDHCWLFPGELERQKNTYLNSKNGFQLSHFQQAWKLFLLNF